MTRTQRNKKKGARAIRWKDEHESKIARNQIGWTSNAKNADSIDKSATQLIATHTDPRWTKQEIAVPPRQFQHFKPETQVARNDNTNKSNIHAGQSLRQSSKPRNSGLNHSHNSKQDFSLASDQHRPHAASQFPKRQSVKRQSDTISASARAAKIPEDNIQLSSSRKFQFDYELDLVGPEGVAKVDIWITEDHGRNWYVWGQDEDKQSPVVVSVKNDGLFGFRIGVTSQDGLSARSPRSGAQADVWIGVDTTKPTAEITSVPYGRGLDAGKLIIQYQTDDRQLASNPFPCFILFTLMGHGFRLPIAFLMRGFSNGVLVKACLAKSICVSNRKTLPKSDRLHLR